jgi:hypothetical protein
MARRPPGLSKTNDHLRTLKEAVISVLHYSTGERKCSCLSRQDRQMSINDFSQRQIIKGQDLALLGMRGLAV